MTDGGQVYCWGDSSDGQCGTGTLDMILSPVIVPVMIQIGFCAHGHPKPSISIEVKQVSCGEKHTVALTQGKYLFNKPKLIKIFPIITNNITIGCVYLNVNQKNGQKLFQNIYLI